MNRLQLSEQEKAIIKDVQMKNFYYRALPLSVGGMMACRLLMLKGSISSNRSVAKVFGAGLAGYLFGKMSVPGQIKERLLTECPDGIFAKASQEYAQMSPEDRQKFMRELSSTLKNKTQNEVTNTLPRNSSTETESADPVNMEYSGSEASQQPDSQSKFSYAEQRSKWNNTDTGIPKPPPSSQQQPPSSKQPEFSYSQQRALNSGGNKAHVQSIPQDPLPPAPEGLSGPPAGTGRKVRRNVYGDEMD